MTGAGFMQAFRLLPFDAAVGDDFLPAADLALDAAAHRLGCAVCRHAAKAGEALLDIALGEDGTELAIEVVDRRLGRAGRDREAEPRAEFDALERLADRRHFGQQWIAPGRGEGERAQPAAA